MDGIRVCSKEDTTVHWRLPSKADRLDLVVDVGRHHVCGADLVVAAAPAPPGLGLDPPPFDQRNGAPGDG